jgi:hypothetical protein
VENTFSISNYVLLITRLDLNSEPLQSNATNVLAREMNQVKPN